VVAQSKPTASDSRELVRAAERNARLFCANALNNQSSDKSVAEVIMKALLAPQVGTGLQSEWTALLRLASEGDVLALRSLLVAMESGNNVFLRIAARAILAQLVESGVVLTPGRLESVGLGKTSPTAYKKR